MPGGDRTGPMGAGSMTGRAMGYCAGFSMPGYANPAFAGNGGRGFRGQGRGRGLGRGFRARGFNRQAPVNRAFADQPFEGSEEYPVAEELSELKLAARGLSERLNEITQRIEQLEKDR